jgi:PKD repeat protein
MISTTVFTPGGTYMIGVSCTGGVGTHMANYSLMVTGAQFDYTVAWSPSSAAITAGSSTTPNVVATLTSGATTAVYCTVSVPGVTGLAASPLTFNITPVVAPGATQAIAIATTTSTPPGIYTISVSCTLGIGSHTASFVLTVLSPTQDTDGDGIFDNVDTQPTVFSNDFSDIPLGGTTSGTILSRGNQCPTIPCQLTIQEASPTTGILITSGSLGGLTPASISVCGGASILSVGANTQLLVKCGSVTVTVITGSVGVTFVGSGANAGVTGTATITAGNSITFQPATFGFAAPQSNTVTIIITINGQTLPLAPGQTTASPFAIFTISVLNPQGEVFAAGATLKFDGKPSFSTTGTITSFVWNFGDGTIDTSNVNRPTHVYTVGGVYTVNLTITDSVGNTNSQLRTINVLPAPLIGSVTFSRNLFASGNLVQNFTVEVTNPNTYPVLVNVNVSGNCDTVCPFTEQSGPVLVQAGQTIFISVYHTFSPLDQFTTFVFQVRLTFTADTSNTNVATYTLAAFRTFSFRIR